MQIMQLTALHLDHYSTSMLFELTKDNSSSMSISANAHLLMDCRKAGQEVGACNAGLLSSGYR